MDLQVDWSSFGNWSNKQQQEEEHQDRRMSEIGFFVDSYLDTRLSEVAGSEIVFKKGLDWLVHG